MSSAFHRRSARRTRRSTIRLAAFAALAAAPLAACQPDARGAVRDAATASSAAPSTAGDPAPDPSDGEESSATTAAPTTIAATTTTVAPAPTAAPSTTAVAPTSAAPDTTAAPTSTTAPTPTVAPTTAPETPATATPVDPGAVASTAPAGTYQVATVIGRVVDPGRGDRVISYRVYAPVGVTGATPVVLVSHGGAGNPRGHLAGEHLGSTFASGGFVAIHLAHDLPAAGSRAVDDRPADVSFVLDELAAGNVAMPAGFGGTPDLTRVGHTGHSFGAYTSYAVGGATYERAAGTPVSFRDDRIDAIAPISPQGPDQFGAFVHGPDDSTWSTVTIPTFDLIGADEIDSNAVDSIVRPGWRLAPFEHVGDTADRFRVIVAGQGHSEMWRTGATDVQAFIATEILDFMRRYVAGDVAVDACTIGQGELTSTTATIERRAAAVGTSIGACV